jgi:isopentenyl-diphosphate delta-isomerase
LEYMSENITPQTSGELLDIVNEWGEPTGRILDKRTIHAQGLRHRDVHVWITNGRDLLQQQRNSDKSIMPNAWDISVGGHVSAGESYRDAAVRETYEELGLLRTPKHFKRIGLVATQLMFPGWKHPHNIVGDNFVAYEPELSLDDLRLQDSEVQGARWYPIEQLERDLMSDESARLHAPQPAALYALGIAGMRSVTSTQ